jgi:DNA-binding transcriptional LysR family regulator
MERILLIANSGRKTDLWIRLFHFRHEENVMSLDANDLILFARVMDAGSFSRAAERIGMPKSTISRRISQLESELGERLLVRSTRRLAISEFGERILDHARRLAEEADAASDLASHRQGTPRGVLRVSMAPDMIELDLVDICLEFSTRYPDVRLELDLSPRHVDLVAERFDIALRGATRLPDDSTLVARKLSAFGLGLYASPAYIARHGVPAHPDALLDHVCLPLIASNGQAVPWVLSRGAERWEGIPSGPVAANSPRLQREFAARAVGIVALDDFNAHRLIEQGVLQRVLPEWSFPKTTLWCVTPGRRLLPARTTAFIALLQTAME